MHIAALDILWHDNGSAVLAVAAGIEARILIALCKALFVSHRRKLRLKA
jgi:hypothetical protein